jgi:hypothetical protein
VCKRWRRLVTDPLFVRRFRAFHRRTPPLHGFIKRSGLFFPTQEPPDRLPPSRFWRDRWCGEADFQYRWSVHCCRHGLVLCCRAEEFASEFLVIDPMTGDRSRIGSLQHEGALLIASTVISVAGGADRCSFLLVALLAHDLETRLTASVYSSDSGAWTSSVTAVFPPSPGFRSDHLSSLVGNAIYSSTARSFVLIWEHGAFPSSSNDRILRSRRCRGAILGLGSCRQLAMGMAAFVWA